MTTHQMKLAADPFEKITSGKKIIESRLYDEKRQQINIGDQIEFSCNDDPTKKVLTKVRALYLYESFEELFSDFPSKYFGDESKDGLVKKIEMFYSKDEQMKCGVIGIKIELV